ncbi:FAD-binding oxidoreductase [uncultured Nitratireductor sp.]|uniref:NAD(P)/FAD-dependent oxidoreductase n=1 Tax=uncultured Nitratireductor sp. TaxID=520953 RepID=UPI0025D15316|nr:FAD-binding oxidoreductase [uncultured Nitratireductor sp.]
MSDALKVVVIGAGIVGAFAAWELVQSGHDVIVLDVDQPGGKQAASYGNGAWIMESSLLPVSVPGLWRQVPGYLMDPLGPFAIRRSHLFALTPWLTRFLLAGSSVGKVERTASFRHALTHGALQRYRSVAKANGLVSLLKHDGHLFLYSDREAFEADGLAWRLRRHYGIEWRELEDEALRAFEPGLGAHHRFGVYVRAGANLTDPGAFVTGLVEGAVRQGAVLQRARATGFRLEGNRLRAVKTESGEICSNRAVLTAGIDARDLTMQCGDRVPLETERGYHVVVPEAAGGPRHPIMLMDGKMVFTRTRAGLRVAGQVELAGREAAPDWRRADILVKHLQRAFPEFSRQFEEGVVDRWMGHRPSTPDGIPCIGPSRLSPDVIYGFGHGHSGITMAPATGRLIADLCGGRHSLIDSKPYWAERFR